MWVWGCPGLGQAFTAAPARHSTPAGADVCWLCVLCCWAWAWAWRKGAVGLPLLPAAAPAAATRGGQRADISACSTSRRSTLAPATLTCRSQRPSSCSCPAGAHTCQLRDCYPIPWYAACGPDLRSAKGQVSGIARAASCSPVTTAGSPAVCWQHCPQQPSSHQGSGSGGSRHSNTSSSCSPASVRQPRSPVRKCSQSQLSFSPAAASTDSRGPALALAPTLPCPSPAPPPGCGGAESRSLQKR